MTCMWNAVLEPRDSASVQWKVKEVAKQTKMMNAYKQLIFNKVSKRIHKEIQAFFQQWNYWINWMYLLGGGRNIDAKAKIEQKRVKNKGKNEELGMIKI